MSNRPKRRKLNILERLPIVEKLKKAQPGFSSWYYRHVAQDPSRNGNK